MKEDREFSKKSILTVIDKHKKVRGDLVLEGLHSNQLELADYLTVYNDLKKFATIDEILTSVLEIYNVKEVQCNRITEENKAVALVFICGLFEINENDLPLVGKTVEIIVKLFNTNPKYYAKNALEISKLDQAYNRLILELETKASISTKNDIQYASHLAKLYADICEGIYGIAITKMAFHASILRGKPKFIKTVSNIPLCDRLNIIKSYDFNYGSRLELKYEPIIRNAASHEGLDFSGLPTIQFNEKNKYGRTRMIHENIVNIEERISTLFSISNVIMTAATISGFHPKFKDIVDSVDINKLIPHLNIDDIDRRFKHMNKNT